jgi:predicted ATP-grasp superfamily ATP-dependent carboligase
MKKLIVLGASVRALAASAIRAGYEPYAIDLFADRDLAAMCRAMRIKHYPDDFLSAMVTAPQAPWIYTGGLENYPQLIERMAKVRPLLGNNGEVVRAARDVVRLGEVVEQARLKFPEIASHAEEGKWLLKEQRSSGGLGVRFATAKEMREPAEGSYLQRYVEGEAMSALFVGAGGEAALIGVTKQLMGRDFGLSKEFLYVGNIGPVMLGEAEMRQLHAVGGALADSFGLVGLFNVDLVRSAKKLWPVEINPRYSASVEVLERGLGVRAVEWHVAACEEGMLPVVVVRTARGVCGKAVVYAERDGYVPAALEEIARDWNGEGDWPGLADLPRTGEAFVAGQPVVTVLAEGETPGEVETKLRRRVEVVQTLLPR